LPYRPIITLTTDFGTNDHFVGAMKGVIVDIVPDAQIVDISHAVQAFDVLDGALAISQVYSYFPNGTIHLVVVDPGVGTERRPILASSDIISSRPTMACSRWFMPRKNAFTSATSLRNTTSGSR
jgi:S-adenosylmethionine hydrolase